MKPTSQSFSALLNAKTCAEIIIALVRCCWEALNCEGEPPIPTPEDIARYGPAQIAHGATTSEVQKAYVQVTLKMMNITDKAISDFDDDEHALFDQYLRLGDLHNFFLVRLRLIEDFEERIEKIHAAWLEAREYVPDISHPLAPIARAWLVEQTHRTPQTATVDHVQDLSAVPYAISEVNRRKWEIVGSVDAIEVDGEPIITHIKQLPGTFSDDVKVLKPKGTQGELMPMPTQRNNMEIPIPLIAYQKHSKNLRSAIASDTAQLMTLVYSTNEPLILSVEEGASLLARGEDGMLRPPRDSDEQRFENAYACMQMAAWITDERGIDRFYPLTACDRFSDNRVSIAAASWARDRKAGRWTLTAGGGIAGQNRLKGYAHNNNVWRVITGIEYWLARERFPRKGPNAKISQALIPPSGTTGPGNWYTLSWQEGMMIAGDIWDLNDKDANRKAYQRFKKIRSSLIKHGYQVKKLHTPAEAGDTVEFLFEQKRGRGGGKVKVRATSRFVEGARKAKKEDWQTVNLSDWIGL